MLYYHVVHFEPSLSQVYNVVIWHAIEPEILRLGRAFPLQ
jgi:hypothetical protein